MTFLFKLGQEKQDEVNFITGSMSFDYLQAFIRLPYHIYWTTFLSMLGHEKQDEVPCIIGSMSYNYLQAFVRPAYHSYWDDIPLYVRAGKTGWNEFHNRVNVI